MGKIKDFLGLLNFTATLKDLVDALSKASRQHRKKLDEHNIQINLLAKAVDERDRRIDMLESRLARLESVAMFGAGIAAQLEHSLPAKNARGALNDHAQSSGDAT